MNERRPGGLSVFAAPRPCLTPQFAELPSLSVLSAARSTGGGGTGTKFTRTQSPGSSCLVLPDLSSGDGTDAVGILYIMELSTFFFFPPLPTTPYTLTHLHTLIPV